MKKRVLLEDIQGNELYPRPCMPIGSVIFLNNTLDPNTYFMGTWEKIEEEVFFMTSSSEFPAGQVSGSNTHTLTIDEIPNHAHGQSLFRGSGSAGWSGPIGANNVDGVNVGTYTGYGVGGGQPFDVRPRKYAINAWVRIS